MVPVTSDPRSVCLAKHNSLSVLTTCQGHKPFILGSRLRSWFLDGQSINITRKEGRKEERPSFIQLPSPSGRKEGRKTVLHTAAFPLLSPGSRGPVRHRHIHVEEPTATENCPGKIVYKLHQHREFIGLSVIPKATPSTPELGPLAKCGFRYKH